MGVTSALGQLLSRKAAMYRNAQVKNVQYDFSFNYTVLYDMARKLTTQNIFQLIVNGVTGNMEIVLQRVEMA